MTDSHSKMGISLDGEAFVLDRNLTLFETLKKKGLSDGFCSHPLLETDRQCNLCLVWDEENQNLVKSCQVTPQDNAKYSLTHPKVVASKAEAWNSYAEYHSAHCKSCFNKNLCDLRDNLESHTEKRAEEVKKNFPFPYSEKVDFFPNECIECGLCLSFEKALGEKPSLKESEKANEKIVCEGTVSHNYSLNLLDICPTGCFQQKDLNPSKEDLILKDFCRGCDRMCETELLFEKKFDSYVLQRQRAPQGATYWICDELNESFLSKNTGLPLRSSMVKKEGQWGRGERPSLQKQWHFVLPENLPDEIWLKLINLFDKKNFTFHLVEEKKRKQPKGLLNENKVFQQNLKSDFLEKFDEKRLQNGDKKKDLYFVSPEWLTQKSEFLAELRAMKNSNIAFAGYFLKNDVTECVDTMTPLPDYRTLTWTGLNYHKEQRMNQPMKSGQEIYFFREEN